MFFTSRLNSYILDLLILDRLMNSTSPSHYNNFTSRLLKALTTQLADHWHRREAHRKRDAERRATLFIEAESRRRKCLNDLHLASATKTKRSSTKGTRAERRKSRQEVAEANELPELVDATLNEEVEWRLRFSEAGAIEAKYSLAHSSSSFPELRLSGEDAIQQVGILSTSNGGDGMIVIIPL